jgi:hypothetical protein
MTVRYNMAYIYINKSSTDSDTLPIPAASITSTAGLAIKVLMGAEKLAASVALASLSYMLL